MHATFKPKSRSLESPLQGILHDVVLHIDPFVIKTSSPAVRVTELTGLYNTLKDVSLNACPHLFNELNTVALSQKVSLEQTSTILTATLVYFTPSIHFYCPGHVLYKHNV